VLLFSNAIYWIDLSKHQIRILQEGEEPILGAMLLRQHEGIEGVAWQTPTRICFDLAYRNVSFDVPMHPAERTSIESKEDGWYLTRRFYGRMESLVEVSSTGQIVRMRVATIRDDVWNPPQLSFPGRVGAEIRSILTPAPAVILWNAFEKIMTWKSDAPYAWRPFFVYWIPGTEWPHAVSLSLGDVVSAVEKPLALMILCFLPSVVLPILVSRLARKRGWSEARRRRGSLAAILLGVPGFLTLLALDEQPAKKPSSRSEEEPNLKKVEIFEAELV